MKNLAEFYNLKCEKSVQPMGSTSYDGHLDKTDLFNRIIKN